MRATVLVADDDEIVRDAVSWVLGSERFRVLTAADGAEAIRRSAKTEVDLFILDVHMPNLDGEATLAAIRAMPRFRDTPILFLTGEPQDAPAGVVNLSKPCSASELIQAVTSLLELSSQSSAEGSAERRRGSSVGHRTRSRSSAGARR